MHLLEFGGQVILVSTLGVLSPGPLFFANLIYGTEQGFRSGIKIAHGHMLVELPLIFLLASGLFTFSSIILSGAGFQMIELGGGIAIIGFALSRISRILKKMYLKKKKNPRFFLTYKIKKDPSGRQRFKRFKSLFLIWWFTIGIKLISESLLLFGFFQGF